MRTPSGGRQAGGRAHSPEGEGTAGEQLRSVPRTPSQAEPVWAAELEALAAVVEVDAWGAALAGARVVWVRMAVVMAEVAGAVAKVVRAGVVVRRAMAGVVRALAGGGGGGEGGGGEGDGGGGEGDGGGGGEGDGGSEGEGGGVGGRGGEGGRGGGDGGDGGGDWSGGEGGGENKAQMVKPAPLMLESLAQVTSVPAATCTFIGPVVPEYAAFPILTKS